jgi:hypothetical protein
LISQFISQGDLNGSRIRRLKRNFLALGIAKTHTKAKVSSKKNRISLSLPVLF